MNAVPEFTFSSIVKRLLIIERSDGMSRVEEIEGAIEKANRANRGTGLPSGKWQILLMTDIAKSLAVIADKMTEEVTESIERPKSLGFDTRPKWPFEGSE